MTKARVGCALSLAIAWFTPVVAEAEYYVAGQVGVNFADRLTESKGPAILWHKGALTSTSRMLSCMEEN